ncbi:zinc finger protein with KRAB and SCAN domains 1-like [Oratosquilla oratoria]|uniref:zinc finger protein with KRAB and SCAN domains 1-like n=1 Tax=Oratosquilla oratoria TaxID=337810 RepID=UPI003F768CDC
MVKTAILRACELVPELYRIKFRNLRKQPNISHVEFSGEKRLLWDQWLRSHKVNKDFDRLAELLLVEEYLRSIPKEVSLYLQEKEVTKLEEAAVLADKYELIRPAGKFSVTHKGKGDLAKIGRESRSHQVGHLPNP